MTPAAWAWTAPAPGWTALGLLASALFASRWLVQVLASRRAGRPTVNRAFWLIGATGSALLLIYFGCGPRRDPVGVVSNLFPLGISLYNLLLARGRGRAGDERPTPDLRGEGSARR